MQVEPWLEWTLIAAGSLAFVLVMRWIIRRISFRFMKFTVEARGRAFTFHRERFWDDQGREVSDPLLLRELEEAWAEIERRTAGDAAAIQSTRGLFR